MSASGFAGETCRGESGGDDGDDCRAEALNRPQNQSMQGARRIITRSFTAVLRSGHPQMNWKRTATLGVIGGTLVTLLARALDINCCAAGPIVAECRPSRRVAGGARRRSRAPSPTFERANHTHGTRANLFGSARRPSGPVEGRLHGLKRDRLPHRCRRRQPFTLVGLAEEAVPTARFEPPSSAASADSTSSASARLLSAATA